MNEVGCRGFDGVGVVVTGSTRGIGRAIAENFATLGASVIFNGRASSSSVLNEVSAIGIDISRCHYVGADVATVAGVENLYGTTNELIGNVDVLVNNAGEILSFGGWDNEGLHDLERTLFANFVLAALCIQKFAPAMCNARWGRIVNIASIYGSLPAGPVASYGAAKQALISYSRSVSVDMAEFGVTVNCVSPGNIDTQMTRAAGEEYVSKVVANTPVGRLGNPEEVADAVVFLARSGFVTGHNLVVDGGISLRGG